MLIPGKISRARLGGVGIKWKWLQERQEQRKKKSWLRNNMRESRAVSGGGRILQKQAASSERGAVGGEGGAQLDDKYSAKAGASPSPEVLAKRIVRELPARRYPGRLQPAARCRKVPRGSERRTAKEAKLVTITAATFSRGLDSGATCVVYMRRGRAGAAIRWSKLEASSPGRRTVVKRKCLICCVAIRTEKVGLCSVITRRNCCAK